MRIGGAETVEQKIYWVLVFLRRSGDFSSPSFKRSLKAFPDLTPFYSDGVVDIRGAHDLLTKLSLERAHAMLTTFGEDTRDKDSAARKTNALSPWIALWSSKRRKVCSFFILGPDGQPASCAADSAKFLYDHWSAVFSEKPVNLTTAFLAISDFIQKCPSNIEWDLNFEKFCDRLIMRKDTGCGPDGLPYSFWSLAPIPFAKGIFDVYDELKSGGPPTLEFNSAKVVFPPKGKIVSDFGGMLTREPGKTRPISLSNTDNKTISSALAHPLNQLAAKTVASFQTGGPSGRFMGDNIINLEAKALQYLALLVLWHCRA